MAHKEGTQHLRTFTKDKFVQKDPNMIHLLTRVTRSAEPGNFNKKFDNKFHVSPAHTKPDCSLSGPYQTAPY
jgi:hypothetical protein